MPAPTVGLSTHIWNNNFRSMLLLGLYPVFLIAIFWACAFILGWFIPHSIGGPDVSSTDIVTDFATGMTFQFWPLILTTAAIWFVVSYFFHTKMIRSLSRSHPVSRAEEPELYNLMENLCISQGVPMPHFEIIETHARNAFASGIDQKSYAITVTRGLLNSLAKDEVEAVLAHELAHIMNRDVRLLIVTIIFTGMIGFAAQMAWSSIRYSIYMPRGRNRTDGRLLIAIMAIAAVLWVGYLATLFTRFAISRRREYMADAGAVEMTKNPDAMMRALQRISGRADLPRTAGDVQMMCIENTVPFLGMFATHPPIEKRIESLSATTNTPIPDVSAPVPPSQRLNHHNSDPKNPWLSRSRRN